MSSIDSLPRTSEWTATRDSATRDAAPPRSRSELLVPEDDWSPGATVERSPQERLTLRHYLHLWKRYRGLVIAITLTCVAGAAAKLVWLNTDLYMAKVTILPSGGQGQGSVMGLLASFTGAPPTAIGTGVEENSSALFPRILESRTVGLAVLQARYTFEADGKPVDTSLYEFLEATNDDEALLILESLRGIDIDKETGMLTVSVRTPYPALSAQICNRYTETLEKFNDDTRHASASQHGKFIRERVDEALTELQRAEEKLTVFKSQNVRMNDAGLDLERLRLERDAALKSQVYTTLLSQAEIARIEEAKNTPVVRILDRAAVPILPVPVPRVASLAAGGILGIVLSLLAVAGAEFLRHLRAEMKSV